MPRPVPLAPAAQSPRAQLADWLRYTPRRDTRRRFTLTLQGLPARSLTRATLTAGWDILNLIATTTR